MIGPSLYAYRNNFNCKKLTTRKAKSTRIKLFNLIIEGYRKIINFDDDYFISIAQYFMKKGYPRTFSLNQCTDNLDKFFMEALFSICPFHYEDLIINENKFDLFKWRKQFDLFSEIQIKELNYYRNRYSMPLEDFTSLEKIYDIIFSRDCRHDEEKLKFSFNKCHKDAIWILSKDCVITKDTFYYKIGYGCRDDYKNMLNKKAHSSWDICIESEVNENYVDFCLRIYQNYDAIISGSNEILISDQNDDENFYLGGRFKLRKSIKQQ